MTNIQLKFDVKELRSGNKKVVRASRIAAYQTINEVLVNVRKETLNDAVRDYKIKPRKIIARVWGTRGESGQRIRINKASTKRLRGTANVLMKGIPVSVLKTNQVQGVGANTKAARTRGSALGGVKATGGRFYPGAFIDRKGRVLKMRSKQQVMVPKIGVRVYLTAKFKKKLLSDRAQKKFIATYNRILKFRLAKVAASKKIT